MILKIKCPNCDSKLNINIVDDEVVSIELDEHIETSQDIITVMLQEKGIEFG